jgi:hypothetical protein
MIMLTNLVATIIVSLVTNTTETLPQEIVPAPPPEGANPFNAVFYSKLQPVKDPKEKWVTTTIERVTKFQWQHDGREWESIGSTMLTNWTVHLLLTPPGPPNWIVDPNNKPMPLNWPPGSVFSR